MTLRKGARSRLHEDALVSRVVLQALADASHVRHHFAPRLPPLVSSSRLAPSYVGGEGILRLNKNIGIATARAKNFTERFGR